MSKTFATWATNPTSKASEVRCDIRFSRRRLAIPCFRNSSHTPRLRMYATCKSKRCQTFQNCCWNDERLKTLVPRLKQLARMVLSSFASWNEEKPQFFYANNLIHYTWHWQCWCNLILNCHIQRQYLTQLFCLGDNYANDSPL